MTAREFRLPDLGEGVAEGELVAWLVAPGDPVTEDQPVAEVETDKALVEIPSPYDGTVRDLRAEPGETVPVGEVIISFDVPDAEDAADEAGGGRSAAGGETDPAAGSGGEDDATTAGGPDAADARPAVAPPRVRRLARELGVDLAAVARSGPGGRVTEADVRAAGGDDDGDAAPTPREVRPGSKRAAVRSRPGAAGDGESRGSAAGAEAAPSPAGRDRTLAAPATRRLAREAGVGIDDVPTDERRDGEAFVTAERVRAYADATARARTGADAGGVDTEAAADTEAGASEREDGDGDETAIAELAGERMPYRGLRRTIGERTARAAAEVPHVTHTDVADVTELVALRAELNAVAPEDLHLTYTPFLLKAVVEGLRAEPYVNARLDETAGEIVLREEYHLGVATATEDGLLVPVIEAVDEQGLGALARALARVTERARERTIDRDEMRGGTFTLTNVGAIGGAFATPVVNRPEVAILATGAIRERPRVVDGEVVARATCPLSLSVDHRVVDGAVAARFTNRVIEALATPRRLLVA